MIKNHNNDLSIPYKVPHSVLSTERRGEEKEQNTRKGKDEEGMTWIGRRANVNYRI
jgi:hypothetical protein